MESHKGIFFRLFLFILGFLTLSVQVILIREFMALFQGNELIIGLFLGFWMIFTAAGSYLSIKIFQHVSAPSFHSPTTILVMLSVLPIAMLYALPYMKGLFIPVGAMAGPGQIILIIIFITAPFCILSGILFPLLSKELSSHKNLNLIHEAYGLDSAGGILGALLFSLALIFVLDPFESLSVIAFICFGAVSLWSWLNKKKTRSIILLLIGTGGIVASFYMNPNLVYNSLIYKNQDVIVVKTSPFGKLAVTRLDEQINIYENGIPLVSGDNPVSGEESVHYAMLLHPLPKNILIIAGGSTGSITEALKYPESSIDYLEINPWMIKILDIYRPFPVNNRIRYYFKDPRLFLLQQDKKYDVILLNTPEPSSAEMNRFYTVEFYKIVKSHLNPGGIFSCAVPAAGNYMNESSRMLHSVYYTTLSAVFKHTRIIPGKKDYYLGSDSSLDHSLFRDYGSYGFVNIYVNPSYISEDLQRMRTDQIMEDLLIDAPVNSDLRPYIFSEFLRYRMDQFRINFKIIPAILIIITLLAFIFLGPVNLGLFAGGFTSSSLEFLLLIWFQVLFGYVYQMTGVIFAVFMAGMAIGSFYHHKIVKRATFGIYLRLQGFMAIFSILVATLFLNLSSFHIQNSHILLIMALVFTSGSLMGIQFSLSARLRNTSIIKSSGESFSADLAGSALGIGLVSLFFVPQFGLPISALVLAGLNMAAVGVIALKIASR